MRKVLVTVSKEMEFEDNIIQNVINNPMSFFNGADWDFLNIDVVSDGRAYHIPYSDLLKRFNGLSDVVEFQANRHIAALNVCVKIAANEGNPGLDMLRGCGNIVELAKAALDTK